ncbi:hypothetical protein DDV21_010160 [Streptococcus chenjunshii]|uniref:Uncharacterized protein n=2 Tax=Streptococcus chenjunshii TaxID=2173853 RepID=A0A372KLS2_9STRE|nr:hypothetical protein DDV21_010160 [Streptococcus chenjunshii]RFU51129.1 hypothetical protein DDV22_05340 [Streptococcus chenjunshii]RFU53227.1 hypothetical protein DDV23_05850 [Streptococcus chenjunshii]
MLFNTFLYFFYKKITFCVLKCVILILQKIYKGGSISMATKTFTMDMNLTFSRKSANNLIKTLENNKKVKLAKNIEARDIKDSQQIKRMFSKG